VIWPEAIMLYVFLLLYVNVIGTEIVYDLEWSENM
jgi:hypothetical protein